MYSVSKNPNNQSYYHPSRFVKGNLMVALLLFFFLTTFLSFFPNAGFSQQNHSTFTNSESTQHTSPVINPRLRLEIANRKSILYPSSAHKKVITPDEARKRFKNVDGERIFISPDRIGFFAKFDKAEVSVSDLPPSFSGRILNNGIVAGYADIADLITLSLNPQIARLEASNFSQILNNAANERTRVSEVHEITWPPEPIKGDGVIIGVIDTGLDFTHPDFSNENGSRILYLLDMQEDGENVEWTKNDIDFNPESITQIDALGGGGHGTHVTGTAAGGGQLNPIFRGVAPESDIIFVKGTRSEFSSGGFSDVDVIDAIAYIFEKADELERPAVVNLSIGGHFGPHDGTSLYEQALQSLQGPGRVIVTAAGNSGLANIHIGEDLTTSTTYSFTVNATPTVALIDAWYQTGLVNSIRIAANIRKYGELQRIAETDIILSGTATGYDIDGSLDAVPLIHDSDTLGFYVADLTNVIDPGNGDGNFFVFLTNREKSHINLSNYIWTIDVNSGSVSGRFDAWAARGSFARFPRGINEGIELTSSFDYTLTIPGTTREIITVGAFVSNDRWVDIDGVLQIQLAPREHQDGLFDAVIDSITHFSGRGPTRDGRMKPEISAPGLRLMSSLSSQFPVADPGMDNGLARHLVAEGGGYRSMQGTSMSAPHVAGIVALMLQIDPNLDYHEIINLFSQHSQPADGKTGPLPNMRHGYGRIDALALVEALYSYTSIDSDFISGLPSQIELHQNYPNPFNPSTQIRFIIPVHSGTIPVRIDVIDILGRSVGVVANQDFEPGSHTVTFDASNLAAGVYVYRLISPEVNISRKMLLLK